MKAKKSKRKKEMEARCLSEQFPGRRGKLIMLTLSLLFVLFSAGITLGQNVLITKSGKKYHRDTKCFAIKKEFAEVSIKCAICKKLAPCKICYSVIYHSIEPTDGQLYGMESDREADTLIYSDSLGSVFIYLNRKAKKDTLYYYLIN